MKTILYASFLILVLLLMGCIRGTDRTPCMESDGNIIEQSLAVASFHSVANYTPVNVYITQSNNNSYSIRMVGSMNILNTIRATVTDGKLRLDNAQCFTNAHQLEIHITMPNILSMEVFGSGKIHGQNAWFTNSISVTTKASGGIDIDVDATHITATITGSGNIKLYGTSPTLNIENTGSGDFNSYGLYCQNVETYLRSSGDVRVVASENLRGNIIGSGDLFYRGYPFLEVNDTGSGSLINDN